MITETEYQNNKQMIEWLQQQCAKAEGSFNQSMKVLRKEFKCKTIEAAKELLSKLEDAQRLYEEEYREHIRKIKRKYKKQLKAHYAE